MTSVEAADQFMKSTGLNAYRVGGSVRDELLGIEPHDADYVVRSSPLDAIHGRLAEMGGRDIDAIQLRDGREVGVRCTVHGAGMIEVVLPRREVSIGKGHRDFHIVGDPRITLDEDAQRRDFTVNALYKNVLTGIIIDPLGRGRDDICARWIRTTHKDSFRDDPLRILRALRFASTLHGFDLVESTYQEMEMHAGSVTALTLKGVSATGLDELSKMLMGGRPGPSLEMMRDSGVLDVLLPELSSMVGFDQCSSYHRNDLDAHVFGSVQMSAARGAPLRVRLALLFHDSGKPWMAWSDGMWNHYYAVSVVQARELGVPQAVHSHEWWSAFLADSALSRLGAPRRLMNDVDTLIRRHMIPVHQKTRTMKVKTWRAELGDELLKDLITHRWCDVDSKTPEACDDAAENLSQIEAIQEACIETEVPRSTKDLDIDGFDLKRIFIKGPAIGRILEALLHEVMAQPKLNNGEWLLRRAAQLRKELR